jgi:hypothetical protein
MDRIGIITLRAEVEDDLRVAAEAAAAASDRLRQGGASGQESCAYQFVRFFNIIEQMGLRIAKAFENHIDDERGWHAELIHRLSIAVPGVRPALYQPPVLSALRDLRGFRHVVTHAYDLELDQDRLALVLKHAAEASRLLPGMVAVFFDTVQQEIH